MNRGEYARQFGRWGEHLIEQLERGHRVGQEVAIYLYRREGRLGKNKVDSIKSATSDPQLKLKT